MIPAFTDRAEPKHLPPRVAAPANDAFGAAPERRNRYARWARHEGLGEGDAVALLMRNQPDVLAIWQGLTSVGVAVTLLDPGLTTIGLASTIDAARPRHLIVDSGLAAALCGLQVFSSVRPVVWWHGDRADFARIDLEIEEYDDAPLDA